MDDLISRAALLNDLSYCAPELWQDKEYIEAKIMKQHAVDAVPVVHARWINYPECLGYDGAYTDEHIVCSACHSVWNIIDNDADRFDHCPVCGAKMDGEQHLAFADQSGAEYADNPTV